MIITDSGTSLNPLTIDGQGEVIDCGTYVSNWIDIGNGRWATPANLLPLDNGRSPGWYKYGETLVVVSDSHVNQGDAVYDPNAKSLVMLTDTDPFELYGEIVIPQQYSGIINTGHHLRIKNYVIKHASVYGAKNSDVTNVEYEDMDIQWCGGGQSNLPRAGDGISFNGNTQDCRVTNSRFFQIFDNALAMQLYGNQAETADNILFDYNEADCCGALISIATHTDHAHSITNALARKNEGTNLGYGWSGYKDTSEKDGNNVHGAGFGLKNYNNASRVEVKVDHFTMTRFAWTCFKTWGGSLDVGNHISACGGTGDYEAYKKAA